LSHEEFENLTPAELLELVEAFNEKERREWRRVAWLAAAIISALAGKSISPKKLLPAAFESEQRKMSREEAREELKKLKERLRIG